MGQGQIGKKVVFLFFSAPSPFKVSRLTKCSKFHFRPRSLDLFDPVFSIHSWSLRVFKSVLELVNIVMEEVEKKLSARLFPVLKVLLFAKKYACFFVKTITFKKFGTLGSRAMPALDIPCLSALRAPHLVLDALAVLLGGPLLAGLCI